MTIEQKYYYVLSPEEWRLLKLNEMHQKSNVRDTLHFACRYRATSNNNLHLMINQSITWATTPQGRDYWWDIANRE